MQKSPVDSSEIFVLISGALTDEINDRELFMKGIDYSYYYETEDWSYYRIKITNVGWTEEKAKA